MMQKARSRGRENIGVHEKGQENLKHGSRTG
jgi:hypothetical protein